MGARVPGKPEVSNFVLTTCRYPVRGGPDRPAQSRIGRELLPFVGELDHKSAFLCNAGQVAVLRLRAMAASHIADIEAAVNFWRDSQLSPGGVTAAPQVCPPAEVCTPPIVPTAGQPVRPAAS